MTRKRLLIASLLSVTLGFIIFSSLARAGDLYSDLYEWFRFDTPDVSGAALTDRSSNAWIGTITGATQLSGGRGQVLSFDGNDDVALPANVKPFESTNSQTLSFWIRYTTTSRGCVYCQGSTASNQPFLIFDINGTGQLAGSISVRSRDNAGNLSAYLVSTVAINDGKWHHVAFTQTGTSPTITREIYVDGKFNGSLASITYGANTTNNYFFGTIQTGNSTKILYLNGELDDFRLYTRVFTAAEIAQLYINGLPQSGGEF